MTNFTIYLAIRNYTYHERNNHHSAANPDSKRLRHRPGSKVVPRLRGLFDPGPGSKDHAHPRDTPREYRYHFRYRLQQPLSLLYGHLWDALDPRPGDGDRFRSQGHASRAKRMGRNR